MSLDLKIVDVERLAGPGRLAAPIDYEVVREINEGDLQALASKNLGSEPPALKRITDRHHSLARLLAAGTPEAEAALITGYDISRVSILKNSPAFQELLALYRDESKREFVSVLDQMARVGRTALSLLEDRLEDAPDRFTNNELKNLSIETTDRTIDTGPNFDKLPHIIELVAPESPEGAARTEDDEQGSD